MGITARDDLERYKTQAKEPPWSPKVQSGPMLWFNMGYEPLKDVKSAEPWRWPSTQKERHSVQ